MPHDTATVHINTDNLAEGFQVNSSPDTKQKDWVGVLVPSGMLGAGFPAGTVERGIALGADVIAIDAGSTDSGPYYLGSRSSKNPNEALLRDLRVLVVAAAHADIPLIVGSCGTSGSDSGVDQVAMLVRQVIEENSLDRQVATIYSEQSASSLVTALSEGRIKPLQPVRAVTAEQLERCSTIVGVMGHEPIVLALERGADIVLAGRATDTAISVAVPLMRGMPAGPAWHMAKIVECGGQCTTDPTSGGVFARVDADGFSIEPLALSAQCTPRTVAAHMSYETVNPFRMREPGGTVEVDDAVYFAEDQRTVRVEGSRFETEEQYTIKLEGAAPTGYQTVTFAGIRDPLILARVDEWAARLIDVLTSRVSTVLGLDPEEYGLDVRLYGHNAILGKLELPDGAPREVGVMLLINAQTQALANAIAKIANPLMLHLPLQGMDYLPSFAFAQSPAETERGRTYEFVLNHVVEVDDPNALFEIRIGSPAHV